MRVLVTGATGILGVQVQKAFMGITHEVRFLSRRKILLPEAFELRLGCLEDTKSLYMATRNTDAIIHLACTMQSDVESVVNIDIKGMANLLKYWSEMSGPFIYISSQSVYGLPKEVPIKEQDVTLPTNFYGIGKLACEKMLKTEALKQSREDFVILRSSPIFSNHPNIRELKIGKLILKAVNNQPFLFSDTYENERKCLNGISWIDAKDLAKIILFSLRDNWNGVYNTANGYVTWFKLVNKIISITGSDSPVKYGMADRSDFFRENFEWRMSTNKLLQRVSFKRIDLISSLSNILNILQVV